MKKRRVVLAIVFIVIGVGLTLPLRAILDEVYYGFGRDDFEQNGFLEVIRLLRSPAVFIVFPMCIVGETMLICSYFCNVKWIKWLYLVIYLLCFGLIIWKMVYFIEGLVYCIKVNEANDPFPILPRYIQYVLTQLCFTVTLDVPLITLLVLSFRKK